jgi:hypothetical protein
MNPYAALRFAYFRGYICTADEHGSIPINAKVVARISDPTTNEQTLLDQLLMQANAYQAKVAQPEGTEP